MTRHASERDLAPKVRIQTFFKPMMQIKLPAPAKLMVSVFFLSFCDLESSLCEKLFSSTKTKTVIPVGEPQFGKRAEAKTAQSEARLVSNSQDTDTLQASDANQTTSTSKAHGK